MLLINATKLHKESITNNGKLLCRAEIKLNNKWEFVGLYHVNPIEYEVKQIKDNIYLMHNRYYRFLLNDEAINILELGYLKKNNKSHSIKHNLDN